MRDQRSGHTGSLSATDAPALGVSSIIGESAGIMAVRNQIVRLGKTPGPKLITGETGTGKELVARELHRLSGRGDRYLVANCASYSGDLVDSELFGHERGAFTGALRRTEGFFGAADGGVLFLDEFGDLPLQSQAKLLRAIGAGEIHRVGATEMRVVDVLVIAATNLDLERAIAERRFRSDLFMRLKSQWIRIPPLRARPGDVRLLADHFLRKTTRAEAVRFGEPFLSAIERYHWPGNVRELQGAIEVAVGSCDAGELMPEHLPEDIRGRLGTPDVPADPADFFSGSPSLKEVERWYARRVLGATGGNVSKTADILGVDRKTIRRKLGADGVIREG